MRILCFVAPLLALCALPAAAQTTSHSGYYVDLERVAQNSADDVLRRPFSAYSRTGQLTTTHWRLAVGRQVGEWEIGARFGWAEESLAQFIDPDQAHPTSASDLQFVDLTYVTVGPNAAWTRPLGERVGVRVEGEAWAGFSMTDSYSTLSLDGAGVRAMGSLGYRIGSNRLAVSPTLGVYGRLAHRFADEGVRSPYGGRPFPATAAVSDLELGLRTALPVLLRVGGVTSTLSPYVDWGSGTHTNGLRVGAGIGLRVSF